MNPPRFAFAIAAVVAAAVGAIASSGCGSPKPTATLVVDSPGDASCIGVVGFALSLSVGGTPRPVSILPRAAPVLEPDACKLPSSASFGDLPTDQPIDASIAGFDSEGTKRVAGSAHLDRLDGGTFHLPLSAVPSGGVDYVVVIDRQQAFGAFDWADAETFTLRTAQGNSVLLDLTINAQISPWFAACDPGAFTLGASFDPAEAIVATMTLAAGGSRQPVRLTPVLDSSGLYYRALP